MPKHSKVKDKNPVKRKISKALESTNPLLSLSHEMSGQPSSRKLIASVIKAADLYSKEQTGDNEDSFKQQAFLLLEKDPKALLSHAFKIKDVHFASPLEFAREHLFDKALLDYFISQAGTFLTQPSSIKTSIKTKTIVENLTNLLLKLPEEWGDTQKAAQKSLLNIIRHICGREPRDYLNKIIGRLEEATSTSEINLGTRFTFSLEGTRVPMPETIEKADEDKLETSPKDNQTKSPLSMPAGFSLWEPESTVPPQSETAASSSKERSTDEQKETKDSKPTSPKK